MTYPESGAPGMWQSDPAAEFGYQASEAAPATQAVADWPPSTDSGPWPQWGDAPPALYPDHPSAPVPRVQVPGPPAAAGPGRPGQAMRGNPGYPTGPMAGPPQLPQRMPGEAGPVARPNGGPRANGGGPRAGGPRQGNPARNRGPLTQDFNTGDIYNTGEMYNTGQFPPARADFPSGPGRQAQPRRTWRPGPGQRARRA